MWELKMSQDQRLPRLYRYMTGELRHLYPMRPGKTRRDRKNRERQEALNESRK